MRILPTFGIMAFIFAGIGRRRSRALFAVAMLTFTAIIMTSCGGGGSNAVPAPTQVATGTQAGSYSLTLNAVSGTATKSVTLNLIVK
jgi:hypothetical protein